MRLRVWELLQIGEIWARASLGFVLWEQIHALREAVSPHQTGRPAWHRRSTLCDRASRERALPQAEETCQYPNQVVPEAARALPHQSYSPR